MSYNNTRSVTLVLGGLYCGGAERVASYLMNHWAQQGWEVTLITSHGPEKDYYQLSEKIRRITVPAGGPSSNKLIALLNNAPYVWRLRKELKKTGSPVVLSFLTRANIQTILAAAGLGKRVIISERNDTTREVHASPWPLLRKILYKYADIVTANSTVAIEGMREYVPSRKLKRVDNPVFLPEKQAEPHKSKMILNVGRLEPQKAQQLLLEAYSQLSKEDRKEWAVEILGQGEDRDRLGSQIRELNLSEHATLHGFVSNPEPFYLASGIFVLSSRYEGTSNALLEAMSYGLPCIVSDSLPGALELIEHEKNGLVFQSGSAQDLTGKISRLIDNPALRKKLGSEARNSLKKLHPEAVFRVWDALILGSER